MTQFKEYGEIAEAAKDCIGVMRTKHRLTYEQCREVIDILGISLMLSQNPPPKEP